MKNLYGETVEAKIYVDWIEVSRGHWEGVCWYEFLIENCPYETSWAAPYLEKRLVSKYISSFGGEHTLFVYMAN